METISDALEMTLAQLHASSVRNYVNPYTLLDWPGQIDAEGWCTCPELVSLYGTGAWDTLAEETRRQLALCEAVNFFSVNVFGERQQMEGLARRLYDPACAHLSAYLHHFLDEENKHNMVFAQFCLRYSGKLYRHDRLPLDRDYAPGEEDFLFFARNLIFEEIAIGHNLAMSLDERVVPIVRAINHFHQVEEARHLRFGRAVILDIWNRFRPLWSDDDVERIRSELAGFLRLTWMQYYNPAAYQDVGIPDPFRLRLTAFDHVASRRRRAQLSERCLNFFTLNGILPEGVQP